MSAANAIPAHGELHLFTDGAICASDGKITAFEPKVVLLPTMPAAIGVTGHNLIVSALAATRVRNSFDEMVSSIAEELVPRLIDIIAPQVRAAGISEDFELTICGYSEARAKLEIYTMPCHTIPAGHADQRLERFALNPMPLGACSFPPSAEAMASIDWSVPGDPSAWNPIKDGLQLMEAQRRTRMPDGRFTIGGFVQHTVISKDRVCSGIIRRWPDKIGETIKP